MGIVLDFKERKILVEKEISFSNIEQIREIINANKGKQVRLIWNNEYVGILKGLKFEKVRKNNSSIEFICLEKLLEGETCKHLNVPYDIQIEGLRYVGVREELQPQQIKDYSLNFNIFSEYEKKYIELASRVELWDRFEDGTEILISISSKNGTGFTKQFFLSEEGNIIFHVFQEVEFTEDKQGEFNISKGDKGILQVVDNKCRITSGECKDWIVTILDPNCYKIIKSLCIDDIPAEYLK